MGKLDIVTKEFMRKNDIFADAFNFFIYEGKPVVKADKLIELDSTEIALPLWDYKRENSTKEAVQKYRDILKTVEIKEDSSASYILLGIENQTDIHYAMPVRNMIYDALQYGRQVTDTAAKHRMEKKSAPSRQEYLSGFWRTDRIKPVITLVIHMCRTTVYV